MPDASCRVTTGCRANASPPVEVALGWVVNASFVAGRARGSRRGGRSRGDPGSEPAIPTSRPAGFGAGPEEVRVAEREDCRRRPRRTSSRCPVGRRRHADDRLVERERAGRAVEVRVAEREDPAVGRDHPVAVARCVSAAMPTIGWFRRDRAGRAVEVRVAEREDAAVGRDQPVAVARSVSTPCRRSACSA